MEENKQLTFINYYDYCLAANCTAKDFGEDNLNIGHVSFGVFTEANELDLALMKNDKVNIGEEVGDIAWNLANHTIYHFKGSDQIFEQLTEIWWKPQYTVTLPKDELIAFKAYLDKYGDMSMKYFRTSKKIDGYNHKMKDILLNMNKCLVSIALNSSITPVQILMNNIDKLYVRYGEKFDSYLCLNRDLIKEYKVLENI